MNHARIHEDRVHGGETRARKFGSFEEERVSSTVSSLPVIDLENRFLSLLNFLKPSIFSLPKRLFGLVSSVPFPVMPSTHSLQSHPLPPLVNGSKEASCTSPRLQSPRPRWIRLWDRPGSAFSVDALHLSGLERVLVSGLP